MYVYIYENTKEQAMKNGVCVCVCLPSPVSRVTLWVSYPRNIIKVSMF